ncbi:MAG: hypothetical protein JNJ43_12935 [Anaerolineales bacterium]|nr:hypothetical protein [Anaerolineales bacterium]
MKREYHIVMTREALGEHFSERALQEIIKANINQDRLAGMFFHDEFHFDNNAFDKGYRYMNEQRGYVLATFMGMDVSPVVAWQAFGRLLHSAQDFYAHSNYVTLWLDEKNGTPHSSGEIEPLKKDILQSPKLHSGKVYFPLDLMYYILPIRPLVMKLLPKDSHGWMNLDSPEQGFKFDYAICAAVKRTQYEFNLLQTLLRPEMLAKFTDK